VAFTGVASGAGWGDNNAVAELHARLSITTSTLQLVEARSIKRTLRGQTICVPSDPTMCYKVRH
jgi:hypothetical protein